MTLDQLQAEGYIKFVDDFKYKPEHGDLNAYKGTWQKRIVDEQGILFHVQVEYWDFANSVVKDRYKGKSPSMLGYAHFNLPNGDTFKVEHFDVTDKSLMEVEAFFSKQWRINECSYYEKFDE